MKKLLYLILYIAVLTVAGCSGSKTKDGSTSEFSAILEQAKTYTYPTDTMNLDTARKMSLALLEHDSVRTNVQNRMQVLRLLTDVSRMGLDYEEQMKWASQLATLCREQGDETEALRTESEIGIVLTHLGQRKEGFAMLDNAIAHLEPQRHFSELDACIIAMKRKLTALSLLPPVTMLGDSVTAEQRNADIITLAGQFIAKLDDYEQHPADYADNSPRQPDTDEVPGYCDFYRSQAYVFLAQAYASKSSEFRVESLEFAAARKKARHYCDLFEQSDFGQTLNGRSAIAETQRLLGDYDKMLATYDAIDSISGADTLNTNYVRQLRGRAVAAEARGQHALSQHYWLRHSTLSETVNDQLQASEAHDYATRYRVQEQQMEILQHESEATRNAILAVAALILALTAICFAVYYFRQQRIIQKKNRVLIEQMTEAVKYKLQKHSRSSSQGGDGSASLFDHISSVIRRERLYLNAQFDRQAAIDYFHLSKERIGAAFSQGSEFPTIADFINHCRLEYAKELLVTSPEMTVDDIASASGFGTRRTFSRLFKEHYSITPTEYRNQLTRYMASL